MVKPRRRTPSGRAAGGPAPARLVVALVGVLTVVAGATGCSNHPFHRSASPAPVSLVPPPGVAVPAATLPPPPAALPSFADTDPRVLQATLARSQQERQLLQDEVAALRDQLASTSSQLAASRGASVPAATTPAGQSFMAAGTEPSGGAVPFAAARPPGGERPATLDAGLADLALPGLEKRVDGSVVRLEIPAERLFDDGGAALMPGGAALLAQVAGELDRVYPQHFIGIEGHLDTEPVDTAVWASPHQLTAARATTVFDYFTTRTPLKRGQLFLVAHGGNHPVVSNATAAGRSRNRRIELVVYPERVAATAAGAAAP